MATSNGTGAPARLNPPQERSQKGEKRAGAVGRNARKATRPDCADRVPETVAAALRDELLISFEHNRVEFTGSAQLLIDEGILPAGFAFPPPAETKQASTYRAVPTDDQCLAQHAVREPEPRSGFMAPRNDARRTAAVLRCAAGTASICPVGAHPGGGRQHRRCDNDAQAHAMNSSFGLRNRVQRLENETADTAVVGIVGKRGTGVGYAEHERMHRRIEELRRAGCTVYVSRTWRAGLADVGALRGLRWRQPRRIDSCGALLLRQLGDFGRPLDCDLAFAHRLAGPSGMHPCGS